MLHHSVLQKTETHTTLCTHIHMMIYKRTVEDTKCKYVCKL